MGFTTPKGSTETIVISGIQYYSGTHLEYFTLSLTHWDNWTFGILRLPDLLGLSGTLELPDILELFGIMGFFNHLGISGIIGLIDPELLGLSLILRLPDWDR